MLELEPVSSGSVFSGDAEQLAAFLSLRDCSEEKAKAVKYLLRSSSTGSIIRIPFTVSHRPRFPALKSPLCLLPHNSEFLLRYWVGSVVSLCFGTRLLERSGNH